MNTSITDRIEKKITLAAAPARVWQAIADSTEFGEWFCVDLEGPFVVGQVIRGKSTHPGCEGMHFEGTVERMDVERRFAMRWFPDEVDPNADNSGQPTTLVEFLLEPAGSGTRLTVIESGFDALPESSRRETFLRNEGGWTAQMVNITEHVDG